ncbi:MAG: translocation/assembly module TamB, partial [Bacteroidota bacterium]|nr:translocation/assembly module TamB [Bacteroidota bacterium]
MNRYARKSLNFLLWLVGIIVVLVGLSLLLIQTAYVQNIAKNKIVKFLENKIHTPVSIDRLSVDFPKRIVLEGVYFEDLEGDTLLAGDTLKVDISMWKLLDRQIEILEIDLRGINSYVKRTLPDSSFSFDYILAAFISDKTKKVDTTGAMRFSVSKINLDRINLKFLDDVVGNDVAIYIKHFDTKITDFNLENQKFTIPKVKLYGVVASMKQTKALANETVTTDTLNMDPGSMYPDINMEEIDISDIHITYGNTVNAIDTKVDLDSLRIEFNKLDLRNQDIDVKLVHLANTQGFFALGETAQKAVESAAIEVVTAIEKGWTIKLDKLDVRDIDYKFDDVTEKHEPVGIDYKHLNLKDLYVDATDFIYDPDTLYGKINQITV